MANQYQSVSSGLGELKNFYQGPMVDQFNQDIPIWRGCAKGSFPWSGAQVNRPLKVRRNPGIGATSDGGNLPSVGRQTTIQAVIAAKYNYLRFGITGPMISASKNDVGSFVRSAAFELKEGYNDLKSDVNRQLSWDGSGDLALMSSAAVATTSIVLKGRESTEPALKFLDVGSVFDIYTSGGALVQAGLTISSITSGGPTDSTATVVVDQAVTASANDVIIRANSASQEIQGLLTQLDNATSTVFSIDRSLYPITQGNVVDLNGAAMALDSLQRVQDSAETRGGAGMNAIYSDYASRRMYYKLLLPDKRYVNTMNGDGGFAAKDKTYLAFNEIPWVADKDCPTRVFFLPKDHIEKYVLEEMAFADETGTMYIAAAENDALEVRVRFFANLFNSKASASGCLVDYISP